MREVFIEAWVNIIKADKEHERECGWSYFDEPESEEQEEQ